MKVSELVGLLRGMDQDADVVVNLEAVGGDYAATLDIYTDLLDFSEDDSGESPGTKVVVFTITHPDNIAEELE
jgi:hypothetical protein